MLMIKKSGRIRKQRVRVTNQSITSAPKKALRRIVAAAENDLKVARVACGLLECLFKSDRPPLFSGKPAVLFEWSGLPIKLRRDARAVIDWALSPPRHDIVALCHARNQIEAGVRILRQRSSLGRHLRARAMRLMRLHPPLERSKWKSQGTAFDLLPNEIGKPLSAGIIELAKSFKPQTLEILSSDAPMNSCWTAGVLSIRLGVDGYTINKILYAIETPIPLTGRRRLRAEGYLIDFFETGTEGVIWMLEDDSQYGRASLETIEEGDHLTILDQLGIIVWRGTIRFDKEIGLRPYPMNPEYSQQCALGCWVHWIQRGFEPDTWAAFFMRPDHDRLRGILRKRHKPRIGSS